MGWLSNLLKRPEIARDARVVARLTGRISGEGQPVGTGHSDEGPCEDLMALLDQVPLAAGRSAGEAIRRAGIPELSGWLSSTNRDPLPRALVRLLFDTHAKGIGITADTEISAFWHEGRPPRPVWDGPATVAQIWAIRICLFYAERGTEQYQVITFDP